MARSALIVKRALQFVAGVAIAYLLVVVAVIVTAPIAPTMAFGNSGVLIGFVIAVFGGCLRWKAPPARAAVAWGVAVSGVALFAWSVFSLFL
ncbi:hypothetical protein V1Y59_18110 [Gordonia sp. PKS22-38]|uniref:Uncharacterized protein n=1 Tax=Gordonia prachuapensis TaxID=3115651 RepID=A0ABU7MXE5_9ACTN|nr:hypothetical protein [Gordonia sp. PKS22-38]